MPLKNRIIIFVIMLTCSLLVRFLFIKLFDINIPIEVMIGAAAMVTFIAKPEKKQNQPKA